MNKTNFLKNKFEQKPRFYQDKRAMGTLGKVFLVIGVIILLIIAYVAFTAYQGYSLVQTFERKAPELEANIAAALEGDCDKIPEVEADIGEIMDEVRGACKNPALKAAMENMAEETGYGCDELDAAEADFRSSLDEAKQECN